MFSISIVSGSFYKKLACSLRSFREKQEVTAGSADETEPDSSYRPVLLPVPQELQAFVHLGPHLVNMSHRVDGPGIVRGHSQTLMDQRKRSRQEVPPRGSAPQSLTVNFYWNNRHKHTVR